MQTATQTSDKTRPTEPIQHYQQHVESHSVFDATKIGALVGVLAIAPGGLLIGYANLPGSLFAYGLSYVVIPFVVSLVSGAIIGGSLGWVMGHVGHASDPVPQLSEIEAKKKVSAKASHRPHLSIHLHRH